MSTGMKLAIGLVVAVVMFVAMPYNGLQYSKNEALAKFADVDAQLKRRADLVPNLVRTVDALAAQERAVIQGAMEARAKATQMTLNPLTATPEQMKQFADAQAALGSSLGRLLATVEAYPQIKSAPAFMTLQAQLEGTENRIAVARRDYNEAVRGYNTRQDLVWYMLAKPFAGVSRMAMFEASASDREVPKVNFDIGKKG